MVQRSKAQQTDQGGAVWTETDITPEFRRTRTVVAGPWEEVRVNCFCCTCDVGDELQLSDPSCRLHGFYGIRACEEHGMPGELYPEPDPRTGELAPLTVQQYREKHHVHN